MEQIFLKMARQEVDKKYVGFQPNSGSVKPVHIASGILKSIIGELTSKSKAQRKPSISSEPYFFLPNN